MPRTLAASLTSAVRRWASGPPAISAWPMSPLVTETNFTWWPWAAQSAAVPAALSSQSSGWAPKTMMRSLPSSLVGRRVAGNAASQEQEQGPAGRQECLRCPG